LGAAVIVLIFYFSKTFVFREIERLLEAADLEGIFWGVGGVFELQKAICSKIVFLKKACTVHYFLVAELDNF
jgi:hypothetical protein